MNLQRLLIHCARGGLPWLLALQLVFPLAPGAVRAQEADGPAAEAPQEQAAPEPAAEPASEPEPASTPEPQAEATPEQPAETALPAEQAPEGPPDLKKVAGEEPLAVPEDRPAIAEQSPEDEQGMRIPWWVWVAIGVGALALLGGGGGGGGGGGEDSPPPANGDSGNGGGDTGTIGFNW